jgi:hypothetical protein
MTEFIGYFALGLGILAMSMKRIFMLRFIHGLSAFAYLIYGFFIEANPVILAGVVFILIHTFHIYQLLTKPKPHE